MRDKPEQLPEQCYTPSKEKGDISKPMWRRPPSRIPGTPSVLRVSQKEQKPPEEDTFQAPMRTVPPETSQGKPFHCDGEQCTTADGIKIKNTIFSGKYFSIVRPWYSVCDYAVLPG